MQQRLFFANQCLSHPPERMEGPKLTKNMRSKCAKWVNMRWRNPGGEIRISIKYSKYEKYVFLTKVKYVLRISPPAHRGEDPLSTMKSWRVGTKRIIFHDSLTGKKCEVFSASFWGQSATPAGQPWPRARTASSSSGRETTEARRWPKLHIGRITSSTGWSVGGGGQGIWAGVC